MTTPIREMIAAQQRAEIYAQSADQDIGTQALCLVGRQAALTALADNVSDVMVEAFKDKLEPYSDASGFDYKSAISAAIRAASQPTGEA